MLLLLCCTTYITSSSGLFFSDKKPFGVLYTALVIIFSFLPYFVCELFKNIWPNNLLTYFCLWYQYQSLELLWRQAVPVSHSQNRILPKKIMMRCPLNWDWTGWRYIISHTFLVLYIKCHTADKMKMEWSINKYYIHQPPYVIWNTGMELNTLICIPYRMEDVCYIWKTGQSNHKWC